MKSLFNELDVHDELALHCFQAVTGTSPWIHLDFLLRAQSKSDSSEFCQNVMFVMFKSDCQYFICY